MIDDYAPLEGGDSAKGSHTATAGNSPEGLIASNSLVERLRRPMLTPSLFLCREAAAELDRLAAENARLREALADTLHCIKTLRNDYRMNPDSDELIRRVAQKVLETESGI